jgi:autotransporter-associated beta strand protein
MTWTIPMNRKPLLIAVSLLSVALTTGGATTLWWTGWQDRAGGGSGSPTRNFRQTESIPGAYFPTPGNGNGMSSNDPVTYDMVFDIGLLEGAQRSMFINRDNIRLGTLYFAGAHLEGFTVTDQAGSAPRGTRLSGGVTARGGLHRLVRVGTDSWALTGATRWDIGHDTIVQLALPLTGEYGLTKVGSGLLALSGAQLFGGGVVLEEGTLLLQNPAAQPATGTIEVRAGAALALSLGAAGSFDEAVFEALASSGLPRVVVADDALLGIELSDRSLDYGIPIAGPRGFAKYGQQTLTLSGAHLYAGPTEVVHGTLQVEGALASRALTTVHSGAAIGGVGLIGGDLRVRAGGRLVFDPRGPLQVAGTVQFEGPFGVGDLVVVDGAAPLGSYRLIDGLVDVAGLDNLGIDNAARLSLTRYAYFQENDGLELVLVDDPGAPAGLATVPGSVVYWRVSPANRFFGNNRIYTTSPTIARMPNGDYLIAFNLFGDSLSPAAEESGTTLIYRSTDRGTTWSEVPGSPVMDLKRGSLIVQGSDVYLFGYRAAPGEVLIRRSTDNGNTWTAATQLTTGTRSGTPANGAVFVDETGQERLWMPVGGRRLISGQTIGLLEGSRWSAEGAAAAISAEPNFGNGVTVEVVSEAQIVAAPHTGVVVMPKVEMAGVSAPYQAYTVLFRRQVASDRELQAAGLDEWVALPGAEKKFAAGYDAESGRFFVLSNPVLPAHEVGSGYSWPLIRNAAAILSSRDLVHWDVEQIFLYSPHVDYEAFQYLNFDIEGDDLLVVSRTAFDIGLRPLPPRGHDSNLITFHRIPGFRHLVPHHFLRLENGTVQRWEQTQHRPAPLGPFVLGQNFAGAPLAAVDGLALGAGGEVLVREVGGRVLRFDESGNFAGLVADPPLGFESELAAIPPPPRTERTWTHSRGGNWEQLAYWLYWGRPDTDSELAVFGSAIDSPATVQLDRARVVKGLHFRSEYGYTVAGSGSLELRSANGEARLQVEQGAHDVDVPLVVASAVQIEAATGSALTMGGGLRTGNHRLTIVGGGALAIGREFTMDQGVLELRGEARLRFEPETRIQVGGTVRWLPDDGHVFAGDATITLFEGLAGATGSFERVELPDPGPGFRWDTTALTTMGILKLHGPSAAVAIQTVRMPDGAVRLEIQGAAGAQIVLAASSDLVAWTTLTTLSLDSVPWVWTDERPLPAGTPRFYRVEVSP